MWFNVTLTKSKFKLSVIFPMTALFLLSSRRAWALWCTGSNARSPSYHGVWLFFKLAPYTHCGLVLGSCIGTRFDSAGPHYHSPTLTSVSVYSALFAYFLGWLSVLVAVWVFLSLFFMFTLYFRDVCFCHQIVQDIYWNVFDNIDCRSLSTMWLVNLRPLSKKTVHFSQQHSWSALLHAISLD